jgi:tmRNA-binding protein
MEIPPYQPNNKPGGYDDRRTRRLLLLEKEIKEEIDIKEGKRTIDLEAIKDDTDQSQETE